MVTCLERTGFLAFLYVMFSCVFVIFRYIVVGQVWYLIVAIPELCFLTYLLTLLLQRFNVGPSSKSASSKLHILKE